jgi:diguanylate cyclase (GGDEF)-like protein
VDAVSVGPPASPPPSTPRARWDLRSLHLGTTLAVKFFVPVCLFSLLAISVALGVNDRILRQEITAQYRERARGAGELFDHWLEGEALLSDREVLDRHISELHRRYPEFYRISVYSRRDGVYRVVASSDAARVGAEADPHDIRPLRTGNVHMEEREDDGRPILEIAYPLRQGGQVVATMGAYASLLDRDRRLAALRRRLSLLALAMVSGLLAVVYLVIHTAVLVPLRRVLAGVESLAAGNLQVEILTTDADTKSSPRDEVGRFARAIQAIAATLREDRDHLRDLAIRDPLTGLYNRRYFGEIVGHEMARAERYGTPFAIAIIDVNGLRDVNNRFGHLAGDQLLQWTGRFLRQNVRSSDEVFRWGGDEFLVLMSHTDGGQALAAVGRLKAAIADHNRAHDRREHLDFSIGVSGWERGRNLEEILQEADSRMYEDKRDTGSPRTARATPAGEPTGGGQER